jgi:uncharacterized protein (DUF302 family)
MPFFEETIARLTKDIADLAAKAGISLPPSTLLVFGNPPLGLLFLTSDPNAGLDWATAGLSGPGR